MMPLNNETNFDTNFMFISQKENSLIMQFYYNINCGIMPYCFKLFLLYYHYKELQVMAETANNNRCPVLLPVYGREARSKLILNLDQFAKWHEKYSGPVLLQSALVIFYCNFCFSTVAFILPLYHVPIKLKLVKNSGNYCHSCSVHHVLMHLQSVNEKLFFSFCRGSMALLVLLAAT